MSDVVDHLRRCMAGLELPVPVELAAQAADEIEKLREAMRWRPASEPPPNSAPVLIVDEDGEVDIASWRACKENLALHWHYLRGICAEALWWAPLPKRPA